MAEGVVSFVVERISELLVEEAQVLSGPSDEVQQVLAQFRLLQPFLRDADARHKEGRVGRWLADLRELVYDADDLFANFLLKAASSKERGGGGLKNIIKRFVCILDDYLYHHKFGRKIQDIKSRMSELTTRLNDYNIKSRVSKGEGESSSSTNETPAKLKRFYSHVVVEPQVVGLQEDVETLVKHLVSESAKCYKVVSICGMGGLGKTTLASKIYNHSTIRCHFAGFAWVSISQKWQTKDVLQRIIFNLVEEKEKRDEIAKFEVGKLLEYLLEIQRNRKCLIVLDDIWSYDAWDSLQAAFPSTTEHFKGKIMLTSRSVDVAAHVDPQGFLHQPQLLNAEQSWELLQMKALPKGSYTDPRHLTDMEKLGRDMVGHCGGLPLAIVVLGGILVTKPTITEWENVHQEIQSSLIMGKGMGEQHQTEVLHVLVLSYNGLPYQLKPCFLYLGKFGEDIDIEAEKLYQLWIAEGMVLSSDRRDNETMMELAESYLAELAHKCMVKVKLEKEESSLRKFKSCRLHDLMRDLSLSKAEEEGFFRRLDIRTADGSHHHDLVESRRLVIYFDQAISFKDSPLIQESTRRRLRSLLWFSDGGENVTPIFRLHLVEFRLLRVLALEGLELDPQTYKQAAITIVSLIKLTHVLGSLFHLRYLSLRKSDLVFFPSFIENLKLLQTLDLRVTGRFCRLPWTTKHWLQKMGRLRHLYLPDYKTFDIGKVGKLRFDGCLSKLETLENFDPSYCEVKDLPKLNSLRKLTLRVVGYNLDDLEEIARYQSSVAPGYLQYLSLSVMYYSRDQGSGQHVPRQLLYNLNRLCAFGYIRELPEFDNHTATHSLTTLILCFSQLSKDPMPVLEKIPTLRKLILNDTFLRKEMVCSAMGFPQLESLTINHMRSLQIWKVDDGAMPNLLKLKIKNSLHLEELPEGLKFLNALRTLEITGMRRELCDRFRVVCGEPGADFYKIAHVPSIIIQDEQD